MDQNSTPHILVLEDHPVFRRFLLSWLSRHYNVTALPTGIQALRWLQAGNHTDALLLDLEMPGVSGWQVAQNLHFSGLFRDLPVVALTSRVDASVIERCNSIGIEHIFSKPYNPEEVLGALAEVISGHVHLQAA